MKPSDFPWGPELLDPNRPIERDENGQFNVFKHADVVTILRNENRAFTRDPSLWSARKEIRNPALDFMWAFEPFGMQEGTRGRHGILRDIVESNFKHRAVQMLEPMIRRNARELLTKIVIKGTGEFDVAREFAHPLATRVISQIVGIPVSREAWVREKLDEISQAPSFDEVPRQWDLDAHVWHMVAERLVQPQSELMDGLIHAWVDKKISGQELVGYVVGFLTAGSDTTGTGIANLFALLAEFGQLLDVQDNANDLEILRRATEEAARFMPPFPTKPLFVLKDTEIGGTPIPAYSVVNIWLSAANRDPAINGNAKQAADPHTFDPNRWPNQSLAFGKGIHYCLGAELARLEMKIALQEAAEMLPDLALDHDKPFERVRGLVTLITKAPFTFNQQAAASRPGGDR